MLDEMKIFLNSLLKWFIVLLILDMFFFALGPHTLTLWGRAVSVPWPTDHSFTAQFFTMMQRDIVPHGVEVIVTGPFDAFLLEMKIAFFLAFVCAFPLLLWSVLRYLAPALKSREKSAIYKTVIPSSALFIGGCVFAYYFVIPATVRIMYSYTTTIAVRPFFDSDNFVSLIFMLMGVTGLMFLMPVVMVLTSYFGIIKPAVWKKYWRHAVFTFILLTAVITPDGTGITMIMLTVPLCILYIGGMVVASRVV